MSESSRGFGSGYAIKQFSDDGERAQIAEGFGEVGMVYSRLMLLMSYRYISSSRTTARRFRFKRTARTADGKVSSQITEALYMSQGLVTMRAGGQRRGLGIPLCFV